MPEDYIIWCGSVLNFRGLSEYRGETPAATQWSRGLLRGFQENGIGVRGFAPMWDALFPKGRLFPGSVSGLEESIPQTTVPYINLPGIRPASVAWSLHQRLNRHLSSGHRPLAILNYNPYPHYCRAIEPIARRHPDIPWVNVVLDLDDPTVDGWIAFKEATAASRGNVFLSWWGYCHAPGDAKLHLDGGWEATPAPAGPAPACAPSLPPPSALPKTFIYAGKFAGYGGIGEILDAIRQYPRQNVFFDFYGKGSCEELSQLAASDPRVRLRGFVPDAELEEACRKAYAFLSPRDLDFQGTRMIFPSKLLFYLKFRKPVLSPLLPGLSPEYESLLIQPTAGWSAAIDRALAMSPVELDALDTRCGVFLETRAWKRQAARLLTFIQELHG
jgi:glycosyltransferase involved in cell wall biosynthesis